MLSVYCYVLSFVVRMQTSPYRLPLTESYVVHENAHYSISVEVPSDRMALLLTLLLKPMDVTS